MRKVDGMLYTSKLVKGQTYSVLIFQQEKVLDTKPGYLHSIPGTHMVGGKTDFTVL